MTIKAFREQSGAKINISNGTSSERLDKETEEKVLHTFINPLSSLSLSSFCSKRLVTVTGTKDNIGVAFSAITSKIQQVRVQIYQVRGRPLTSRGEQHLL